MNATCPSCNGTSIEIGNLHKPFFLAGIYLDEFEEGFGESSLQYCRSCRFYFKYPAPSSSAVAKILLRVSPSYWEFSLHKRKDWIEAQKIITQFQIKHSILDIGCSTGQFLNLFPDWDRFGIEINPNSSNIANSKGIKIIGNSFSDVERIDQKFGVIIAMNVIEHIRDPLKFLAGLQKILLKDGLIFISTGNSNSMTWKLMQNNYWYCTIADHVSFINLDWCMRVSSRLGLYIEAFGSYSYKKSLRLFLRQALVNLMYRFFPGVIIHFRKQGWGGLNVPANPWLAHFPPRWETAKDHFYIVFRSVV